LLKSDAIFTEFFSEYKALFRRNLGLFSKHLCLFMECSGNPHVVSRETLRDLEMIRMKELLRNLGLFSKYRFLFIEYSENPMSRNASRSQDDTHEKFHEYREEAKTN